MRSTKLITWILVIGITGWACSTTSQPEDNSSANTSGSEPEVTEAPALSELAQQGEAIYGQHCVACHQTDGQGMSGVFPTLVQTKWVEGDKTELIGVILNGMQGAITVKEEEYNNVMPAHNFLSDEEIAGVLSYVRQSFGNNASEITTAEVTEVRASVNEDNAN